MLNTLAQLSILACSGFVLVALLAEMAATRQMVNSHYRCVPFIRLCRQARIGAALMVALFWGVSFVVYPLAALILLFIAAFSTLSFQSAAIQVGSYWDASLRTFLPTALVLCLVGDMTLKATPNKDEAFTLGASHAALVCLSAIGFWLLAELRARQDRIRYQD